MVENPGITDRILAGIDAITKSSNKALRENAVVREAIKLRDQLDNLLANKKTPKKDIKKLQDEITKLNEEYHQNQLGDYYEDEEDDEIEEATERDMIDDETDINLLTSPIEDLKKIIAGQDYVNQHLLLTYAALANNKELVDRAMKLRNRPISPVAVERDAKGRISANIRQRLIGKNTIICSDMQKYLTDKYGLRESKVRRNIKINENQATMIAKILLK